MMEQPHTGECHYHAVFISTFNYDIVAYGAARLSHIADTAASGSFDVVAEREEGVGAERYAVNRGKILSGLGIGQRLRLTGKIFLPVAIGTHILFIFVDISVDDIIAIGAAESRKEGQLEHFFVLTQKPCVRFASGKTRAVYS